MEKSFGVIFDKIPCTIAHGFWPDFGATLKIQFSSNFLQNIYMHQKIILTFNLYARLMKSTLAIYN